MTGIDAFERYQHERRVDLGAPSAAARPRRGRRSETLRGIRGGAPPHAGGRPCAATRLRTDVLEMRLRMRKELSRSQTRAIRHQARRGRHRRHRVSWCSTGYWRRPAPIRSYLPTRTIFASSRVWRRWACSTAQRRNWLKRGLHRLSHRAASFVAGGGWRASRGGGAARRHAPAHCAASGARPLNQNRKARLSCASRWAPAKSRTSNGVRQSSMMVQDDSQASAD